jgi:2-polyprenyl-6-methoxyphenol hydroxylase-like FAD-dependent oxidoreductase
MSASGGERVAVLVVGAGPVGLVLACELARRGTAIRVVDKLQEPTDESRAILVHARSLEMMQRIGMVDALVAGGVESTAAEFHADGGLLGRVPLDSVHSPFPFTISTPQTETERVLTERLAELGVTIERGVELVALEQDDDEVRSTLRHADGNEEIVTTSYVAGTDGSHSTVRHRLGTKLEGSFKGKRFLLGDVEGDYDLERDAFHTFLSHDAGPVLVFPMAGSRVRVIAMIEDGDETSTLEHLQAVCDTRALGMRLRSAHWLTVFEIHHGQVPQYRHGRVFLAGDAAHVHSPAGGQGMNTGMQDAFNLGWKLALVAAGGAAPGLLDSYHDERHPVAERVIESTTRVTNAGTLHHDLARRLRNHAIHLATALEPIRMRLADATEEIDVAYRDSPIVARHGPHHGPFHGHGAHPGESAPDVPGVQPALHTVLAEGTGHIAMYVAGSDGPSQPLVVDGLEVRHVLVADDAAAGAGSEPGEYDAVVADPERAVAARYGFGGEGGVLLVRPDGYIGLHAHFGDDDAVSAYVAGVRAMR